MFFFFLILYKHHKLAEGSRSSVFVGSSNEAALSQARFFDVA